MPDAGLDGDILVGELPVVAGRQDEGALGCQDAKAAREAGHAQVVREMVLDAARLDAGPNLGLGPGEHGEPADDLAAGVAGPTVELVRDLAGPGRRLLGADTEHVEDAGLAAGRPADLGGEAGQERGDLAGLLVARAVAGRRAREHAAGLNLRQEVALGPADDLKPDAVVPGLALGELAGALPLDPTEVGMDDDDAVPDAGDVGELDDVVEHGLGVLPGAGVDEEDVERAEVVDDGLEVGGHEHNAILSSWGDAVVIDRQERRSG